LYIGRKRDFSKSLKHFRKRKVFRRPSEPDKSGIGHGMDPFSDKLYPFTVDASRCIEWALLPSLRISDEALPLNIRVLSEGRLALLKRLHGIQTKYFHPGSGRFLKQKTGVDHTGIIDHKQTLFREVAGNVPENILINLTVFI
jgi:hypothetical protein